MTSSNYFCSLFSNSLHTKNSLSSRTQFCLHLLQTPFICMAPGGRVLILTESCSLPLQSTAVQTSEANILLNIGPKLHPIFNQKCTNFQLWHHLANQEEEITSLPAPHIKRRLYDTITCLWTLWLAAYHFWKVSKYCMFAKYSIPGSLSSSRV